MRLRSTVAEVVDLINQNESSYAGSIYVGSKPTVLNLTFDTGSAVNLP
jgi:hypothetical protein